MTGNRANPAVYVFGDFRLDPNLLTFQGTVVHLTPKAIQTLYLLVARAPAVVTKQEILEDVWPDTFVVESSLTRNISVIRKALEDRLGRPCIETLAKRGYRFTEAVEIGDGLPAPPPSQSPSQGRAIPRRGLLAAVSSFVVVSVGGALVYHRSVSAKVRPDPSTLIGWHLFYKLTPAEVQQSLAAFEKAVAENPHSASAQAGLASALLVLSRLAGAGKESFERARVAAATAVRLDPNLGVAHAAQGTVRMVVDWDMQAAGKSFRRALELDSGSILALVQLSQLLSATGRLDEALAVAHRASAVDPVSPILGVQVGVVLYAQRRFEDAAAAFRSVLQRERSFALAHYYLGLSCAYLGRFEEGERHLSQADLHPEVLRTDRAWLALVQGDPAQAESRYRDLESRVRAGTTTSAAVVLLAACLGKMDDAFAALEVSARERHPELLMLRPDPRLEPLRRDPRYADLIRRLRLDGQKAG